MKPLLLFLFLSVFSSVAFAENKVSLNGFKLWQMKDAVVASMGKPFRTVDREYSVLEAYSLSSEGYMVFEYLKEFPHNVYSIQITGRVPKMFAFEGLKLGDQVKDVIKNLGKPDEREKLKEPAVEIFRYKNKNYSIEIDSEGALYSIRLGLEDEMMNKVEEGQQDVWKVFSEAVLSKDINLIVNFMRPDVEIYKDGTILTIDKRFSDFESKPDRQFIEAFVGDGNSLRNAIKQSKVTQEMRILEKVGVGIVCKFYDSDIVKEVVFFPYNGKYRVYEVAFENSQNNQSI